MPQDQRTPRAHVIDVFVPIEIPDPRALAPVDEKRRPPHRAEAANRAVDPSRNHALGRLECLAGCLEV